VAKKKKSASVGRKSRSSSGPKAEKKAPAKTAGAFVLLSIVEKSAAAGAGVAGAGAASTATADRVGGGDGETGAVPGLDKIYLDGATGGEQSFFHQKADTIFFKRLIVVFWLVQSQSQ